MIRGLRRGVLLVCLLPAVFIACDEDPITPADAVILAEPADQSVVEGTSATFTVTASDATSYQWQSSSAAGNAFVDIAAATSASYTTPATSLADDGSRFRVVVAGASNSVTSAEATLSVGPEPVVPAITAHPIDQSVLAPATASFAAAATGVPAPTLQWQVSIGGGAFTDIAGATGTNFTTPATGAADDGNRYRAVATNAAGSATSDAATLSVTVPVAPSFTQHPEDVAVVEGEDALLSVVVEGVPAPTLQWQTSTDGGAAWSNVSGATNPTLARFDVTLGSDGDMYRAVADNGVGAPVVSDAATLTVTPAPAPLEFVTESPLPSGLTNTPYTVTLAATGGTPPYTFSDPYGSIQPGWTLDSTTGEISGSTAFESSMRWTIRVTDSSNPQQSAEQAFDVSIALLCDQGMGSATVAGAPITIEGRFCPGTVTPPGTPNQDGVVYAQWVETFPYGGGSYYEIVTVHFDGVTGELQSVAYFLNDPSRIITYLCIPVGTIDYPQCTGLDVDIAAQSVHFENTLVGSGTSPGWTLNGELRY